MKFKFCYNKVLNLQNKFDMNTNKFEIIYKIISNLASKVIYD
ncbi:hypothetical protein [Campylobacter ureolyticus]|nr:hypothetical protein [Campylobacter ureolyticus]